MPIVTWDHVHLRSPDPEATAAWLENILGGLIIRGPGRIDVCDAPGHLLLTMQPGTDEEAEIEAVLTPEGDRTRLVVEERGLPLDVLYAHGAGWQAHVEDLGAHLAGQERTDWHARWTQLSPSYREMTVRPD